MNKNLNDKDYINTVIAELNDTLLKEEIKLHTKTINDFNNPVTKKIRDIIEEEENIKWQIKKIEVRLISEQRKMHDKIKHEQLLREQRLYQNKLVNLHS